VLGLTVFTVGAVVRPAEPLMYVVPTEADLVVEARMEPQNIDQVYPGQPARLRFSAFNQRTTPEVDSTVVRVAPDALTDEATGVSYYPIELAITPDLLGTRRSDAGGGHAGRRLRSDRRALADELSHPPVDRFLRPLDAGGVTTRSQRSRSPSRDEAGGAGQAEPAWQEGPDQVRGRAAQAAARARRRPPARRAPAPSTDAPSCVPRTQQA
jgi:hypothetical protein